MSRRWLSTIAVAVCACAFAGCAPEPLIEASPSPVPSSRDAAAVCADVDRLDQVVSAIPPIQRAHQADEQARTQELAQALRSELDPLIEAIARPERPNGFDSQIDAVIDRLEHGAEHLDDYLTGRSPGNLGDGLEELEAAASHYRSAAREYYPGVDCPVASVDAA